MSTHLRRLAQVATLGAGLALLPCAPGSAQQQPPDLSGVWDLQTVAFPASTEVPEDECVFSGTAEVSQSFAELSGTASLTLVSGPDSCPAEMSATLSGSIDGSGVFVQLSDPVLGTADLQGEIGTRAPSTVVDGTMNVTQGPFSGYLGTFSAILRAPGALPIPTLGNVALIALVLMLASLGALMARDRRRSV